MQAYIQTKVVLAEPAIQAGRAGFRVFDQLSECFMSEGEFEATHRPVSRRDLTLLATSEAELGVRGVSSDAGRDFGADEC